MIHLDLTGEEANALLNLLQYQHSELRMEIASTDNRRYRNQLKERKVALKAVRQRLEKLQAEQPDATAQPQGE